MWLGIVPYFLSSSYFNRSVPSSSGSSSEKRRFLFCFKSKMQTEIYGFSIFLFTYAVFIFIVVTVTSWFIRFHFFDWQMNVWLFLIDASGKIIRVQMNVLDLSNWNSLYGNGVVEFSFLPGKTRIFQISPSAHGSPFRGHSPQKVSKTHLSPELIRRFLRNRIVFRTLKSGRWRYNPRHRQSQSIYWSNLQWIDSKHIFQVPCSTRLAIILATQFWQSIKVNVPTMAFINWQK